VHEAAATYYFQLTNETTEALCATVAGRKPANLAPQLRFNIIPLIGHNTSVRPDGETHGFGEAERSDRILQELRFQAFVNKSPQFTVCVNGADVLPT